jgi:cytochrome c551/c552
MLITRIIATLALFCATQALALSPDAETGKTFFPACDACHNPNLNPPLGPPMFGIQRQYQRKYETREAFIDSIVQYVKQPQETQALMKEAIEQLKIMPAMPLPDNMLRTIATYMFEADFPPPCAHWQLAIEKDKATGNEKSLQRHQFQYERFCSEAAD